MINLILRFTAVVIVTVFIIACTDSQVPKENVVLKESTQTLDSLDVYKSPTCGCCGKWIDHIHQHGLQTNVHNTQELSAIKNKFAIAPNFRSCHTAVSENGYIFEGHVPAKFIHKFLAEKHVNVIGLSVPSMPLGSPGMEMDNQFMPYKVLLLHKDGSYSVYQEVNSYEEQF